MPKSLSPSPLSPGLAAWLYCFHILLLVIYNPAAAWSHAPRSLLSLLPSEDPALSATALSQPSSSAIAVRESVNITSVTTFLRFAAPAATHSNEVGFAFCDLSRLNHSDLAALSNFRQQMVQRTTTAIVILSSLIAYISINSLVRTVNPSAFIWSAEDKDEARWIASSHSWFDRKACRWLGLCGTAHYRAARPRFGQHKLVSETLLPGESNSTSWRTFWSNGGNLSDTTWDETERSRREIPDYIFRYAPLVHLFSGEQFWPGDIAEHLYHTTPTLNYTPIRSQQDHPTLQDLNQLNEFQEGRYIFLTSNDDVEDRPSWMEGEKNIPEPPEDGEVAQSWADWDGRIDGNIPGDTPEERAKWYDASQPVQDREGNMTPDELGYLNLEDERVRDELRKRYGGEPIRTEGTGGHSNAPAVLIVMDKGNGVVDAFWFYFYSFNLGNVVLNVRFGNHVGDWEHCLVRFHHGKPKALFFSAHSAGEAYSYEAVEKNGERPVIYSALGTHAMYATPGIHDYILPWGLLHDQTDRGPLWDPLLNSHSYTYDYDNDTLLASTFSPDSPTEWFYYNGHWGDKFYPLGDHRQYRFAGQYHYVNGPLGPRFKHLDRRKVCQGPDEGTCVIKNYIGEHTRAKRWLSTDPGSNR